MMDRFQEELLLLQEKIKKLEKERLSFLLEENKISDEIRRIEQKIADSEENMEKYQARFNEYQNTVQFLKDESLIDRIIVLISLGSVLSSVVSLNIAGLSLIVKILILVSEVIALVLGSKVIAKPLSKIFYRKEWAQLEDYEITSESILNEKLTEEKTRQTELREEITLLERSKEQILSSVSKIDGKISPLMQKQTLLIEEYHKAIAKVIQDNKIESTINRAYENTIILGRR